MRLAPLSSCAALALAMLALPSHALFKVVAPDGTVTYTDRPPAPSAGRPSQPGKEAAGATTLRRHLPTCRSSFARRWPASR